MKTGGMTFRGILLSLYGSEFHVCEDPAIDSICLMLNDFSCIEFHTLSYNGDFIHMHKEILQEEKWDLFEGVDSFIMFRDPVDQVVSQFYYMLERRALIEPAYRVNGVVFPETIEQYIESPWHFNNQLAFLVGKYQLNQKDLVVPTDLDRAKELLLKLNFHVGILEKYAGSLEVFERVTGRTIPSGLVENRNQNPNRLPTEAVSKEIIKKIQERSALDIQLYELAKTLFEKEYALLGTSKNFYFKNALSEDSAKAKELSGRGYTVQPFLGLEDVGRLLELHRSTIPETVSDYHVSAFNTDIRVRREIFDGVKNILNGKIADLVPGYQLVMATFVTKKAHSVNGRLGLHQDYTLVEPSKHLGLNVWIPLCDVDHRNGCLKVIDGSQVFNHISATPPNPSPFDYLRSELDAGYMIEVPMKAGEACLFDTGVLHETEENVTDVDRVALFLNLVPETTTPKLFQWNKENPEVLELYEISSEFLLNMTPNTYIEDVERYGARLIEIVDYKFDELESSDLAKLLPMSHLAQKKAAGNIVVEPVAAVAEKKMDAAEPSSRGESFLKKALGFLKRN